jgi:viologen exporter family transport system permease protein
VELARPYVAAFSARFILMLQYRAAAVAGFATQCWWGAIKVMVYVAFYRASRGTSEPISLAQVITYTWLAQGFLALAPWACDPEIALAVRSGGVSFDRLRPVDTYSLWYARAAAWMTSRVVPRATLMFLLAGIILPVIGLGDWSWKLPPNLTQAVLFVVSMVLVVTLASAVVMVLNIAVVVTLNDRGVNYLLSPFTIVLSGNLIPLALFPDWMQLALFVQPFAGVVDIPFRIYSGNLSGRVALAGLALQAGWTLLLIAGGRAWMTRVMQRLDVQGG